MTHAPKTTQPAATIIYIPANLGVSFNSVEGVEFGSGFGVGLQLGVGLLLVLVLVLLLSVGIFSIL